MSRSSSSSSASERVVVGKARTLKEGQLSCKCVVIQNRRAADRSWRHGWAILRDNGSLFLYHASSAPPPTTSPPYTDPMSGVPFPVVSKSSQCHVQLASDYKKRQRVFRLITSDGCELLLQSPDAQNLCEWLFEIRRACRGRLLAPIPTQFPDAAGDTSQQSVTCCSLSNTATFRLTSSSSTSSTTSSSPKKHTDSSSTPTNNNADKLLLPPLLEPPASNKRLASSPIFLRRGVPACLRRSATVNNVEIIRLMNPAAAADQTTKATPATRTEPKKNFTIPLDECEYGPINPHVPLVVIVLAKLIQSCGIRSVGIYRQSGSVQTTSWMVSQLNKGLRKTDFTDPRWHDSKAVASTLKCFFAKLPECLFSKALYSELIKSCKINDHAARLRTIRNLIHRLPTHSVDTLQYITRHFGVVASKSEFNKVDVQSIAIIFGPTLLWHPDRTLQGNLADNPDKVRIIETVVNYNSWIFDDSDQFGSPLLPSAAMVPPLPITYTTAKNATPHEQSRSTPIVDDDPHHRSEEEEADVEPIDIVQAVIGNLDEAPATDESKSSSKGSFVSNSSRM